jgi:hypothetical protein
MAYTDSREDKEDMLACAKRSISDYDAKISTLMSLRDTQLLIVGKLQGELYGRIKPLKLE